MTERSESPNPTTAPDEAATREAIVQDYLAALNEHQLEKCLAFYADDGTIEFQSGIFKGPAAIADWHRERFAAGFQVLDVDRVTVTDDTVVVEAAIASARLRSWKINRLSGKATVVFDGHRIKEVRLAPKMYNPFEGW
jgi:uncharacterized protein (TIGR02246 family)